MADEQVIESKDAPPNPPPPAEAKVGKVPDASSAENLIARHGSAVAAVLTLMNENHKERESIRELRSKLPPEGSRILLGEDVKHWEAYRQLGSPSDLRKSLDAGKQYEAEVGNYRRAEVIRSAAEVTGFKVSVLTLAARDLEIEIEEQKGKDGKAIRVAVVKGEGDTRTALRDYAEANWKDLLPSLRIAEERSIGTPRAGGMQPRPVPSPAQGATNGTLTPAPTRHRSSF